MLENTAKGNILFFAERMVIGGGEKHTLEKAKHFVR